MLSTKDLKIAYDMVNDFKRFDLKTKTFNTFTLIDYQVPKVDGIHSGEYGKGINKVKPSLLEYMIFKLHNVNKDMIFEAIICLLYYWKFRREEPRIRKQVYIRIHHHYAVTHCLTMPIISINDEAIVYYISFSIGSLNIVKIGVTTDINRFNKLISDITNNYPLVSVGNFKVMQIIQFKTKQQAMEFEKEAIKNIKLHKDYKKCKNYFDGYTEAYYI
jgi:hypothetical protein